MSGPRRTGWHPDPRNGRLERWWEGDAWTPVVRPVLRTGDVSSAEDRNEPKRPREPLSTDVKRAVIIAVLAGLTFAAWGYTGLTNTSGSPSSPPAAEPAAP